MSIFPDVKALDARLASASFSARGPSGQGRAIAVGEDAGTLCALAAQVSVDRKTGEIRVQRVVAAQDMGLVINPEGAKMQIEGCINMGLGYVLSEELQFRGGEPAFVPMGR